MTRANLRRRNHLRLEFLRNLGAVGDLVIAAHEALPLAAFALLFVVIWVLSETVIP